MNTMNIAIDGPAGAGKSTIAKKVAKNKGYIYVLDGSGGMQKVEGSEELVQRVLYKLTARREGFPFLPELGSELYRLGYAAGRARNSAAEQAVREALRDETDLDLAAVELMAAEDGLYTLKVYLDYYGQRFAVALAIQ